MNKEALTVKSGESEAMPVLGTNVRFLLEAARTNNTFSLMEVELPKDQGPPPHDHPWDEAYYIIDGDVWFLVGDKEQVFSTGDFVYAPGGLVHAFHGAGEKPARVLVFDAPATAEGFFREASREVVNYPEDLAKVPEIGLKHGMRFMPPPAG
jgi:quercetin dioxygenase-like cupin family protein